MLVKLIRTLFFPFWENHYHPISRDSIWAILHTKKQQAGYKVASFLLLKSDQILSHFYASWVKIWRAILASRFGSRVLYSRKNLLADYIKTPFLLSTMLRISHAVEKPTKRGAPFQEIKSATVDRWISREQKKNPCKIWKKNQITLVDFFQGLGKYGW